MVVPSVGKLRVYGHDEVSFNHNGLGVLYDATEVKVSTSMDGTRTLEFSLDYNSRSWKLIKHRTLIKCGSELYRVTTYNRKSGEGLSQVTCFHVFADAGFIIIPNLNEGNKTPYDWLSLVFEGSRFNVLDATQVAELGMELVTDPVYLESTGEVSAGDILSDIMNYLEKGELYINNWNIAVVNKIGSNKKVRLSEVVNVESIEEESDSSDIINVILVRGKDALPLPSAYPDSVFRSEQSIALYGEREGVLDFDGIDDPIKLLAEVQYACSPTNPDRVDMPRSGIKFNYIDLSKVYANYPMLGVGDVVEVPSTLTIDHLHETRITNIEYYPLSPENSSITIGSPPRTITDLISAAVIAGKAFGKVTDERGKLKAGWLTNIKNVMRTYVKQKLLSLQVQEHTTGDIWVDPNDPNKALAVMGGMLAIAKGKTPEGDWAWNVFGDGDGFTADLINVGQLNTALVKIQDDKGLMKLFSRTLEIFRSVDVDGNEGKLGLRTGINDATGEFEFTLCDKEGNPTIWFDGKGDMLVRGKLDIGAVLAEDFYSEAGDITDLTVNSLQTSDFVKRFNLGDDSPVLYTKVDDAFIGFYKAELESVVPDRLKNPYGEQMYWRENPKAEGVTTDVYGDLYSKAGRRILMTTTNTGYPVEIYKYKHKLLMRIGLSSTGFGSIQLGAGVAPDSVLGKVSFEQVDNGGKVVYTNLQGNEFGIGFSEQGLSLINAGSLVADIRTASYEPLSIEVRGADPVAPELGRMWLIADNS